MVSQNSITTQIETSELPGPSEPTGFMDIQLGLELTMAKNLLKSNSYFDYRGDPDVSLLARPNESLIETRGMLFIKRAYLQFYEKRLYTIILELEPTRMDHFTMYTILVEKYGSPTSLDPTETIWEFETVRLSLERPLSVKYIDKVIFESLLGKSDKAESLNKLNRELFLEQF